MSRRASISHDHKDFSFHMLFQRAVLTFLLSIVPACSDPGFSIVGLKSRELWEAQNIHDYIIEQQRKCFCPYQGRVVEIVVRADTIATISGLDSLHTPIQGGGYKSIDSLFAFIDWARALPNAYIEVAYDEQYGFPKHIFLDRLPNAVDDEVTYNTSHFRRIR